MINLGITCVYDRIGGWIFRIVGLGSIHDIMLKFSKYMLKSQRVHIRTLYLNGSLYVF